MDLGLGGYSSSDEEEDVVSQATTVGESEGVEVNVADGASPNSASQKISPVTSEKASPDSAPSNQPSPQLSPEVVGGLWPPVRVKALNAYASSSESEPENEDPLSSSSEKLAGAAPPAPSTAKLNIKPPEKPKNLKPKKRIPFPSSPLMKPKPNVQQNVRKWVEDIRSGKIKPFQDAIQREKKFLNPSLLTLTCKEFHIAEYSTNFSGDYKKVLAKLQHDRNSYLALRDQQNRQIKHREKRKQKNLEDSRSKRQKTESRFLPRAFSSSSLSGLNVPPGFMRQISAR